METKPYQIRDIKLHIREGLWDEEIVSGEFQQDCYFPPKDMKVAIDIGAHIGGSSIYFASLGAEVYAFEPDKDSFELLLRNVKENGFENKIHCFNKAVGTIDTINIHPKNSGMNGVFNPGIPEKVETISLDEIFKQNNIEHCDLLKVDCEGGEYDFFPSASVETLRKIKQISMELHFCTENHKSSELIQRYGIRYAENLIDYLSNFYRFDVRNSPADSARFYVGYLK